MYLDTIKLCFHSPPQWRLVPAAYVWTAGGETERNGETQTQQLRSCRTSARYCRSTRTQSSAPHLCRSSATCGRTWERSGRSCRTFNRRWITQHAPMKGRSIYLSKKTQRESRMSPETQKTQEMKTAPRRKKTRRKRRINTIEMWWSENGVKERQKCSLDALMKLNPSQVPGVKTEVLSDAGLAIRTGTAEALWHSRTTKCEADSSVLLCSKHPTDRRPFNIWTRFVRPAR